ncbi:TraB/GumN family protein [Candidatus Micrarchaeota archaeon]|nr:TraB/GumN family protein [Candidatus Micrarchaeota archaeon]MBU2475937.1 TraB/GumN family protein [Candidatus Micrarchaeota archaeon]
MDIEKVKVDGKEIILVGTAHISDKSVDLVKETIEKEKPDSVGIELDYARFKQLESGNKWQETNVSHIVKTGKTYLFLINLMLSNMQRKLGKELGIKPGAEMLEAFNIAKEKGLVVELLDRDVQVTLKRALAFTGLKEKIKILMHIVSGFFSEQEQLTKEKVESLKQKDVMTELMNELARTAPTIKKVLVDERDLYIANRILESKSKKIVAVVGAGHLEGIKTALMKERIDLRPLKIVPKKKSILGTVLKYSIPAVFIVFLVYAFYNKGVNASIELIFLWFIITGVFSALGALLARAHPVSIIVAFLAAPFTTLHPALAAGWFAGAAEIKFNSPKVKDFENLNQLDSVGSFYSNKVTKILLVTAFTNIGATIGVIIALPYILSILA